MDAVELWNTISAGGFPLLAFLILWTGYKGIWVWGKEAREKYDASIARAERAEAGEARATKVIEDKLIPLVIRVTRASENLENRQTNE